MQLFEIRSAVDEQPPILTDDEIRFMLTKRVHQERIDAFRKRPLAVRIRIIHMFCPSVARMTDFLLLCGFSRKDWRDLDEKARNAYNNISVQDVKEYPSIPDVAYPIVEAEIRSVVNAFNLSRTPENQIEIVPPAKKEQHA